MEIITSRNNEKIKYACALKNAQTRKSERKLLAEGLRLCADAAQNGVPIETCFLTHKMLAQEATQTVLAAAAQAYLIEEPVAEKLADTKNPQGIFCVCAPENHAFEADIHGKYILLEGIKDPGNLGTAIRTAEAFGLSGAILCGCCDAFSPKALRASMGAGFRFPLLADNELTAVKEFIGKGMCLYCAVVDAAAEDVKSIRSKSGIITAVGSEAAGLSKKILALGTPVTIHMRGRAESFNAAQAATVLMYEMSL